MNRRLRPSGARGAQPRRLPVVAARPLATRRTLAIGRRGRHAYFNAFCALVAPAR